MVSPKSSRILGIDYGMRRLGLAWSDASHTIASPLQTVMAEGTLEATAKKLIQTIEICSKQDGAVIEEMILGYPLHMNGRVGLLADEVTHFAELLRSLSPIPIRLWDERLSTSQAERSLKEVHLSRKKRAKVVDIVSAAIILQSYLDYKKCTKPN